MKNIRFTNWNTVLLNGKEIELSEFFTKLEQNIEHSAYGVYYEEETGKIIVRYNLNDYNIILSDSDKDNLKNGSLNPIIKHLLSLAHLQKFVDSSKNGDVDISEILDDDTRKLYLEKLKNRKFSLKDYFSNLVTDLHESLRDTSERFSDNMIIHGIIWFFGSILGSIIALALVFQGAGLISLLCFLAGFALDAVIYAIEFIYNSIKNRIKRFIKTININKLKKRKIRNLQKSLENSESMDIDTEKSDNNLENNDFKNGIPLILNRFVELLNDVDPLKRNDLTRELRELVEEYIEIIDGNSISDRDLFIGTEDLQQRIVDLNLKILLARANNTSDSRKKEARFVLNRVDSLSDTKNTSDTGVPCIDFDMIKSMEKDETPVTGSIQGTDYPTLPSDSDTRFVYQKFSEYR